MYVYLVSCDVCEVVMLLDLLSQHYPLMLIELVSFEQLLPFSQTFSKLALFYVLLLSNSEWVGQWVWFINKAAPFFSFHSRHLIRCYCLCLSEGVWLINIQSFHWTSYRCNHFRRKGCGLVYFSPPT